MLRIAISTSMFIFPRTFLGISNLVLKSWFFQYQIVCLEQENDSAKRFIFIPILILTPINRRCSEFNLMIRLSNLFSKLLFTSFHLYLTSSKNEYFSSYFLILKREKRERYENKIKSVFKPVYGQFSRKNSKC